MHLRTYPLLLALSPDPRVHDAVMTISPSSALANLQQAQSHLHPSYAETSMLAQPAAGLSSLSDQVWASPVQQKEAHYYRRTFQRAKTRLAMDGNP
ncbi:hypothetical protein CORC01_14420 [Colletotrichum orchidophilum]|uniref:Uncharacterized protein n=1 Tax=Colletotrichum orchidophilum TaxID=1209926 RepID=A0A1G4AM86_9PEZI|nr:uncharacterized protein CORC01_14420 [Colletotrichum orchidophilum]OHE90284.1 hypothetical protein CORC01_14420 [Colletotrichum orchidophilum]